MILVIDTNVFISGFISPNNYPWRILDYFLDGRFTLALDDRIYLEYANVLRRPKFNFDVKDVSIFLNFVKETALFVTATKLSINMLDFSDLKFIEVAKSSEADALITGNIKHFQKAQDIIKILTPKEAWKELF